MSDKKQPPSGEPTNMGSDPSPPLARSTRASENPARQTTDVTRPRKAKTKTAVRNEQAVKSDEGKLAPTAPESAEGDPNDPLPF